MTTLQLAGILAETLAEVGEAPSGVCYAGVMAHASLAEYEIALGALIRAGLVVQEPSHMLKATSRLIEAVRGAVQS